MSQSLISRNPDLLRLRNAGYTVATRSGYLLVADIPYVSTERDVRRGTLVMRLTLNGDRTGVPDDHTTFFQGDAPCDRTGQRLTAIEHSEQRQELAEGVLVDRMFSAKPQLGSDTTYYDKVTRYVDVISGPAEAIDPAATARVFRVVEADAEDDTPFRYVDTASTRAGIAALAPRLAANKVAIVGLGGTGAYILDAIAKTPVREIHLYDADAFQQHNAFRSPGAASLDDVAAGKSKVAYYAERYSIMRTGIVAHETYVDDTTDLSGFDFVFVAIDSGTAKKPIVVMLERLNIAFIDVGMGLHLGNDTVGGMLRVTSSSEHNRSELHKHVSLDDVPNDNVYGSNVQIGPLNMLNAALAVARWMKTCGYLADLEQEHHTIYTVDGNNILNVSAEQ